MKYTTDDLRKKWLAFWEERGHKVIPSASVIPDNDPTALFHNSGMHPLVPYLMGEVHPGGTRLANAQKCIRTGDIEEVGDATHLTFFEMLGNWSLGDYGKGEQIKWSFEFLTKVLELPLEKLAVSVFAGDEDADRDSEAVQAWIECGIPEKRIAYLGKKDNWWAKGDVGPCGPDSEMFYWTGDEEAPDNFQETASNPLWVEIWNDVFMEYHRDKEGKLHQLPQKNIDTGMGLERTVAVLNGFKSVYQTDAFTDILAKIAEISGQNEINDSSRIIADHLRASTIMLGDGIVPSNTDQGYILRRLIRRAIRHGRKIGAGDSFCNTLAKTVIVKLSPSYPELKKNEAVILEELEREEAQFAKTLEKGLRIIEKMERIGAFEHIPEGAEPKIFNRVDANLAFDLYQTYGFPLEMTQEELSKRGLVVDENEFYKAQELHQQKSRAGAEAKFAGGLGDRSEETVRLHTATHLLHAALRKVLGDHVEQRGSNITPERLRFDFTHGDKMTPEQIAEVEKLVNEAITADAPVTCVETTVDEAKKAGAIGLFEHKYGDKVKMYTMGDFSREICGGPHVNRTGELGSFKIKKEESSSRGVRRIKAVVG